MTGSLWQVNPMKKVPLSLVKGDLSKYLRLAESEGAAVGRWTAFVLSRRTAKIAVVRRLSRS